MTTTADGANPSPSRKKRPGGQLCKQKSIFAELKSLYARVADLEDRISYLEKRYGGRPQRN